MKVSFNSMKFFGASLMFEGFHTSDIVLDDTCLHVATGGTGPALLLLHGYPQNHVAWHKVAPLLAQHFSLIIPDLPGYGQSRGPAPETENYTRRRTAESIALLLEELGHERVLVAGHDRGARVGFRLALDRPELVGAFAAMDIVPTLDACEAMDYQAVLKSYHWPFLAQPAPMPERLIGNDPDFYLEHLLSRWAGTRSALDPDAVEHYRRCFRNPSVIAATCADYRAAMSLDLQDDSADRSAGRKIACPVMVLWGRRYFPRGSPVPAWRHWADDVTEIALDCGHFNAEEEPEACAEALLQFFNAPAPAGSRGQTGGD